MESSWGGVEEDFESPEGISQGVEREWRDAIENAMKQVALWRDRSGAGGRCANVCVSCVSVSYGSVSSGTVTRDREDLDCFFRSGTFLVAWLVKENSYKPSPESNPNPKPQP